MSDPVNNPSHYNSRSDGMECIELVEMLPFCEGNAIKYIWRCDHKGARAQDLAKARWYIERARDNGSADYKCDMRTLGRASGGFDDMRIGAAISAVATRQWAFALKCIDDLSREEAA